MHDSDSEKQNEPIIRYGADFEKHSRLVRFVAKPSEHDRWKSLFGEGNVGEKIRKLMNQAADMEEIKRGLAKRCEACGHITRA